MMKLYKTVFKPRPQPWYDPQEITVVRACLAPTLSRLILLLLLCATTLHGEDAQDEIDPEQLTPIMPDEVLPANKPDNNHMKMMMEVCKDQIVSMMLNGIEIPDTGILQDVDHFIFMWDRTIKTSNDEQDATKISAHCYVGKEKGDITKLLIDGIQVI